MSSNQLDKKSQALVGAVLGAHERPRQALYAAASTFDKPAVEAPTLKARLAHAEMLAAQGVIISDADRADIRARHGDRSAADIESRPRSSGRLDLEDVHLNIEARLVATRRRRGQAPAHGPLAQRPGRDRCASVAAWRDPTSSRARCSSELQKAMVALAPQQHVEDDHAGLHAPAGRAARERSAHHVLAYVEMFSRDEERMARRCGDA